MYNKKNNNLKRSKTRFEGIDLNTLGQSYNFNNHSMKRSQSEFFEEINKSNNYESPNKYQKENIINQANDLPIINETIEKTDQFCTILKKRISGLKNIMTCYKNKNYDDAIYQLSINKDLGVINDFCNYGINNKDINSINLSCDDVIRIFPSILNLCNSKYDNYFITGINSAWMILKLFYDRITSAKKNKFFSGIDLNRDEKLRKYDIIIDYFYRLSNLEKIDYNMRKYVDGVNLIQFFGELEHFIKECN